MAVLKGKVGNLDGRYYTETELDAGQLDNRYYTQSQVNTMIAVVKQRCCEIFRLVPTGSDDFPLFPVRDDVTIVEVFGRTDTGTCTFNLRWRPRTTARGSGTLVMNSSIVADSTGEEDADSWNDATIPADSIVDFVCSAVSGTPGEVEIVVYYD